MFASLHWMYHHSFFCCFAPGGEPGETWFCSSVYCIVLCADGCRWSLSYLKETNSIYSNTKHSKTLVLRPADTCSFPSEALQTGQAAGDYLCIFKKELNKKITTYNRGQRGLVGRMLQRILKQGDLWTRCFVWGENVLVTIRLGCNKSTLSLPQSWYYRKMYYVSVLYKTSTNPTLDFPLKASRQNSSNHLWENVNKLNSTLTPVEEEVFRSLLK